MTRILLFTGKGGVGKTTTAAATALRCAEAGLRTVVLSTDPAHSLADAFDVPLGPLAAPIVGTLWGQQLDAQERMEESWHEIQGWLKEVFAWAGVDGFEAEELSVVPGLDEIFALTDIKQYATSGDWDVVVVDCAPTAETIRFLSLPDILARYMERLFPVGRRLNKVASPVLSRLTSLPMAGDDVFAATRRFYDRLEGVREILTDPATTSVRLVVNPERIVIAEARRTYTYLSLFGYRVDAVVANRLLPEAVADPWFEHVEAAARRAPQGHRRRLRAAAGPQGRPRPRRAGRPRRPPRLRAAGVRRPRPGGHPARGPAAADPAPQWQDHPVARPALRRPRRPRAGPPGRRAAGAGRPYRRAVALPDSLRGRPVADASLKGGTLKVVFEGSTDHAR